MAADQVLRSNVLAMYRTLLRLSKSWRAQIPDQTGVERQYIYEETRRLFRLNQNLSKPSEIEERLREAEARLAMAEHYRNPYPRPVNLPHKSFAKREGKKVGKAIEKKNEISKPIYVKSIDDTLKQSQSNSKS